MTECGAPGAMCVCILDDQVCDGRHLCECGGSWRWPIMTATDIILLPSPVGTTATWQENIATTDIILGEIQEGIDADSQLP